MTNKLLLSVFTKIISQLLLDGDSCSEADDFPSMLVIVWTAVPGTLSFKSCACFLLRGSIYGSDSYCLSIPDCSLGLLSDWTIVLV
jgi:hypothetical protein